jgi:WD40 repeat protein
VASEGYAVWDTRDWRLAWKRSKANPHSTHGAAAAVSPDGRLAACSQGKSVVLADLPTGADIALLEPPHPQFIAALNFSPDGRWLVAASRHHYLHLWDLRFLRERLAAMNLGW